MKLKFANALSLALIMAMLFTSIGLASSVDVAVVDVTVPTGSVTLTPGASGSITINMTVTGNQAGTATFEVYRDWTLSGGIFTGSNPQQFTVNPRGPSDPATTFTTSGSVTVATSQVPGGPFTLAVSAFDITNSNATGAKLADGADSNYKVTVAAPVNTAPILSLPAPITAEATSASGAVVTYAASATDAEDNPDPTPSCNPASGSTFPLGSTTVNCSVTDSGGMSASGSFTVTVQDTTAPSLTLPSNQLVEATGAPGAVVSYAASATDLVDGSVAVTCSPASGSTFGFGSTTVNCSASDSRNNSASGSFSVSVQDTTAPTLNLPANIVEEAAGPSGNLVTYTASATDAVDGSVSVSCAPASGSTFPIAATTVDCSATDSHSNTATGSFSVTVADTTAPVIAAHADETAEATGPGGAMVNYAAPATSDAVDGAGVASCSPASGSQFPLGDTTVTCNASDAAGNDATPTTFQVHVVDTTPPSISFVSRTPANGNGWNNGDVTVNWSCTDLVGVLSASVSETISSEGENQSATGTCQDTSGNTADDTQSGINIDLTAPTATAGASPAANSSGWNNTNVTVSFSGTDNLSGIESCSTDVVLSSEGAGQSASGTCIDRAGNVSGPATASGINIDKTAPTASAIASPAPNVNGWNNSDVTVSFSGSDGLSGIASCSAPVLLSTEGAGQSTSGTCTDNAGNVSAPATATASIDKTAPTVSLVGGPANGVTYYFGFVPAAPTCSASDALSGIDGSCNVSGYSNALGSHTVSASATDKAGNSASASASYTVAAWTLSGFYQPVDMGNVWNTVKNGSTVPLKFEIFAGSTELKLTSYVTGFSAQAVACPVTGFVADEIEVLATGGTSLRFDTTGDQFIYNWQTPKKAGACYKITMTTLDGSKLEAFFKLK